MKKSNLLKLFCLVSCLVSSIVLGSNNYALSAETIKIGVAGPHTGDLTSYGLPSLHATELVAAHYNANGGLLGKQIEIIAQDDQCKPEIAVNVATKLVSDGVAAVLGHICSGATEAALPFYTNQKIILISPTATAPNLTQGKNPYFFRTIATNAHQTLLVANFLEKNLKVKKVAILHDSGEYGKDYADSCKALLEKKGIEVVLFESVNPDAVDFSSIIRKIKRVKAEALLLGAYHPTASKLKQQMNRDRLRIPFMGPDSIKTDTFIEVAGKDSEGVYATYPRDTSSLDTYKKAHAEYLEKYKTEPGPFYDNAYSAALALFNAIEKAGNTNTDAIMDALHTETIDTPSGRISFSLNGEPKGIGLSIFQVKDGKYIELNDGLILE